MKKLFRLSVWIITVVVFLGNTQLIFAQENGQELTIKLRKNFGYGGIGNDIQGLFSINTSGVDNLNTVNFYIDDKLMGTSNEPPFSLQFHTSDYDLGNHRLHAVGINTVGEEFISNQIPVEFVSAQQGWKTGLTIVVVILSLTFGGILVSAILTGGLTRRSKTTNGSSISYGYLGGVVCPNCNKPYARHIWGLNVGMGKLDRCPHCKKWGVTRRATAAELTEAEKLLIGEGVVPMVDESIQEQRDLNRDIEESKYVD